MPRNLLLKFSDIGTGRAVYWCQNFDTIRYNTYNSDIQYIVPILYLAFFSRNTVLNNDTTDFLQFISTNNNKDLFESMIQEKKKQKNRKKKLNKTSVFNTIHIMNN